MHRRIVVSSFHADQCGLTKRNKYPREDGSALSGVGVGLGFLIADVIQHAVRFDRKRHFTVVKHNASLYSINVTCISSLPFMLRRRFRFIFRHPALIFPRSL